MTAGDVGEEREVLELAHHHPGRLRVRANAFGEGGEERVLRVRAALQGLPGVTAVTHTVQSGSILVEYSPGHAEPDEIIAAIADAAGLGRPLPEEELRRRRAQPALLAIGAARELNALTQELTGFRADLRAIAPMAMAGLAAYSFMHEKGARMPRWDNLLYWSFNIFTMLHRREIDAAGERPKPET